MNRHVYKIRLALLTLFTVLLVPLSFGQAGFDNPGMPALTERVDGLFFIAIAKIWIII